MMARQMQAAQGQFGAQAQLPQQQPPPPQRQQLDLAQWQQIIAAQQQAQQQFVAAQSAAAGWGGATAAAASAPASIAEPSVPAPVVGAPEPEPPGVTAGGNGATAELDAFIQQLATRAAELYAQLGPHATVVQTLTTLVVACHRGGYKRDAELAAGQLWEVIRASRFPGGVGETPEGIAMLRAQLGAMMDQALGAEGAAMLAAAGAGGDESGLAAAAAAAAAQSTQYAANARVGAH